MQEAAVLVRGRHSSAYFVSAHHGGGAIVTGGLGPPPAWAADSLRLRIRWHELAAELQVGPEARGAAEVWLAAWDALQEARAVNAVDGAENVDTAKLLAQLRGAMSQLLELRRSAQESAPRTLQEVRLQALEGG